MGSRILAPVAGALASACLLACLLAGLLVGSGGAGAQGFQAPGQVPENCQKLVEIKKQLDDRGSALQAAGKQQVPVSRLCSMFRAYVTTEAQMIKAVETDGPWCGVPPQFGQQLQSGHSRAISLRDQACAAAAQANRPPPGPSLSDALNAPAVPDSTTATSGFSTFETLTGNALTR
jgi:hypothetical protein